jgi:hypothetical protein
MVPYSTVKFTPLLEILFTLTIAAPEVAVEETVTAMLVLLHEVTVPFIPLKDAVLLPWVISKPEPTVVTDVSVARRLGRDSKNPVATLRDMAPLFSLR